MRIADQVEFKGEESRGRGRGRIEAEVESGGEGSGFWVMTRM
jgi:hypothetical protein